ncbi:MAG: PAS domain S-box protein [Bdellovibrionales bacterium]|nr:PAS domain S-box protein [Bdellovibrionales bacterium]
MEQKDVIPKKESYSHSVADLKTIVDSLPCGIFVIDRKRTVLLMNTKAEQLFKFSPSDIIGRSLDVLWPGRLKKDGSKFIQYYNSFLDKPKDLIEIELDAANKKGLVGTYLFGFSSSTVGNESFTVVSFLNITPSKNCEKRFQLLVDGLKDYAVLVLGPEGNIQCWNSAAKNLFGYSSDEVMGTNFSRFYLPEEIQEGIPQTDLRIAKREGVYESEGFKLRKNGESFYSRMAIKALYDDYGVLQGFGFVSQDLTERRKEQEQFQGIVESVPSGILMIDIEGNITMCNSELERQFGYTIEELIGKKVELLIPERFKAVHPKYRKEYVQNPYQRKMGATLNLTGLRKDGSEIPIEVGIGPIDTAEGLFIVAIVLDISLRMEMEEELRDAYRSVRLKNEELEQFVYTVSHDLKAPLVTGSSFIGFLREDLEKGNMEEVFCSLERIEKSQNRMRDLINDLLELSRVGRVDLALQRVNLTALVNETVDGFQAEIRENGVQVEASDEFPEIVADPKCIRQVLDNFIGNALKYGISNPSPKIKIYYSESENDYQICVQDNGKGIHPNYHERIFGLFQRLEVDGQNEGTGVGLAIVSRIAQLHGGKAWVVSEEGQGAQFTFSASKKLETTKVRA